MSKKTNNHFTFVDIVFFLDAMTGTSTDIYPFYTNVPAMSKLADAYSHILVEQDERVHDLWLEALDELQTQLTYFTERGFDERLIEDVAQKRKEFILQTRTKAEMQKVLHPNYCDDSPKYGIDAEEVIFWGEMSFRFPLNQEGFQRYERVFKRVYGDI